MNAESDWWSLCDLDPAAFPWPHFADWLEERRDPRADAAREVGRRWWVPCFHGRLSCWSWWRAGAACPPAPDDLPPGVFDALPGTQSANDWRAYRSPSAACRALLDALAPAPAGAV